VQTFKISALEKIANIQKIKKGNGGMSVPSAASAEAFWLLHQFKYSKIETHIQHLIRKDPGANIQDQRFRKNSQHSKNQKGQWRDVSSICLLC
jgi:hypothetical protein